MPGSCAPRLAAVIASSLLAASVGCERPGEFDQEAERPAPAPESTATWEGTTRGGGFGSRIAIVSGIVHVSAPFAGEVWVGTESDAAILLYEFGSGTFAGAGLASDEAGRLLVGAPTAEDGWLRAGGSDTVAEGNGVGGTVAGSEYGWAASTRTGWVSSAGQSIVLGRRPDALAYYLLDHVAAGAAWGETAVWFGEYGILRRNPVDEAGAVLARCNTSGFGSDSSLAVGAPGEGAVYALGSSGVWTSMVATGANRFGAAVVCGPQSGASTGIVIGAPHHGTDHNGAVYAFTNALGGLELLAEGEPGDELGTALAYDGSSVYAGAPGGADSLGKVVIIPYPE